MVQKYSIAKDEQWYLAWPDIALTKNGKLVCIFTECTHHGDRSYSRIMLADSIDRGRTWSAKRPLSEALYKKDGGRHWNCARITALSDGTLIAVADRVAGGDEGAAAGGEQSNWLWQSTDDGVTWKGPAATPVRGIVPDKVIELVQGKHKGRWILSAHTKTGEARVWTEHCWVTDDNGKTWQGLYVIASVSDLKLCEGSVMECPDGTLVCFMRENSGQGLDCYKAISHDGGIHWEGVYRFPLPGCHRPVAGMLADGSVLVTYRFMQGGKGWLGSWTQNFFAAFTDIPSVIATQRNDAWARIVPIDYDRSTRTDLGYSGWVQFGDGEIYIVNYIVDDWPRGQIRGYSLRKEDVML